MNGKHETTKKPSDPTYNKQWSGISYAPHCKKNCHCPKCGERLHNEDGNHYCPRCDDYVAPEPRHEAQ